MATGFKEWTELPRMIVDVLCDLLQDASRNVCPLLPDATDVKGGGLIGSAEFDRQSFSAFAGVPWPVPCMVLKPARRKPVLFISTTMEL